MKIYLLLLSVLLSKLSFAQNLPMPSDDQFSIGNYWTWTYYTEGDSNHFYSSERYQVIKRNGTSATFEIQSRYSESGDFTPSSRFTVDLSKCYNAFRNPKLKLNFMIALYPYEKDHWARSPIRNEAVAFEEKFNCNPIVHHQINPLYETRFDTTEFNGIQTTLFQQWPKYQHSQIRSLYFMDYPGLEGIAFRKSFNPGTSGYYEMRLTDWGNR